MTKAQEIRNKQLELVENDSEFLTKQAEELFDWLLDLIDSDDRKKYFRQISLFCFYGEDTISVLISDFIKQKYDLSKVLEKFSRISFFKKLKEVIEKNEGYKAHIVDYTQFSDLDGILLLVVIE